MSRDEQRLAAEFEALVGRRVTDQASDGLVDDSIRLATEKEELRRIIYEAPVLRPTKVGCRAEPQAVSQTAHANMSGFHKSASEKIAAERPSKKKPRAAAAVTPERESEPKDASREEQGASGSSDSRPAHAGYRSASNIVAAIVAVGTGLSAGLVFYNVSVSAPPIAWIAPPAEAIQAANANVLTRGDSGRDTTAQIPPALEKAPTQVVDAANEQEMETSPSSTAEAVGILASPTPPQTSTDHNGTASEMLSAQIWPSGAFLSNAKAREVAAASLSSATPQYGPSVPIAAERKAEANSASDAPTAQESASTGYKEPKTDLQPKRPPAPLPPARSAALGQAVQPAKAKAAGHVIGREQDGVADTLPSAQESRISDIATEPERASVQGTLESIAGFFQRSGGEFDRR